MRDDMFSWLLRKKRTTPVVPDVHREAVHASAEAPSSATVVEAPIAERVEAVELAAPVVESPPAPAPEIHVTELAVEGHQPEPAGTAELALDAPPIPEASETAPQFEEAPAAPASDPEGPRPQPLTAGPHFAASQHFSARMSRPRSLLVLQGAAGEIDLLAGLEVVEHSGRHVRPGRLIAVRADGRRLLASLGSGGRIRAYTLRRDGIYRLEGASDSRAPVLELVPDAGVMAAPASER